MMEKMLNVLAGDQCEQATISGFRFPISRWRGGRLHGRIIAIDTETAIIVGHEIPPLSVATASDGQQHVLVHPDDLGKFILTHQAAEFVCHNAAFDFWVIYKHLTNRGEVEALRAWVQAVHDRRLHDTMLLDSLIRLTGEAGDDNEHSHPETLPRNLEEVVRTYTGLDISKADPYRLRFAEIIGANWDRVDPGFWSYAIKDPIGTILAYREMSALALEIMVKHGFDPAATDRFVIAPDAIRSFGLLSEAVQVEGAIALAQLRRNGLCTAPDRLHAAMDAHRRELASLIAQLRSDYPGILQFNSAGQPKLTQSGLPSKSVKQLAQELLKAVEDIRNQSGVDVVVPRTDKGAVSRSLEKWEHLAEHHSFLRLWRDYEKSAKRSQFFAALDQPVLHPSYRVMVSTGRTSCSKPNVQQIPRDDAFREIIVPSSGHLLLSVDYCFVELVTLAAVCQARFGFSRLGDIIRQGIDPHCYTAAMLLNVTLEEFMSWKASERDRFKQSRQQAKPVNFGVPGGMGPEALVDYAWKAYRVKLTLDDARRFHWRLTQEIYPELGLYLADTSMAYLAGQLRVPESICRDTFSIGDMTPSTAATVVRKVLAGQANKKDGTPYQADFVRRVWDDLNTLNRNPDLAVDLAARVGRPQLAARLFDTAAVTPTGRVRGNTSYTAQRNTPFQGLASDGAKRALCRLVLAGFRVVGFVHDEILVELPDQGGFVDLTTVEAVVGIMCEAMQDATYGMPVRCEYALSDRWSKSAELIVEGSRVRAWRPTL